VTVPAESARPRSIDELPSVWRGFQALRLRLDGEIRALYGELGISGVNTRFSMAIMFLENGDASIGDLALRCGVTHSAMSQSVQAMRRAGLVSTSAGTDGRSRIVRLTAAGAAIAPVLWREWYATESAVAELEAEAGCTIDRYVAAVNEALGRRSLLDRIRDRLDL